MESLEEVIKNYVYLYPQTSANGWYPVLCKVCNDHGKKGPRAAFHLDGDKVGYNCFNCKHKATIDPSTDKTFNDNALVLLRAFDIPTEFIEKKQFELFSKSNNITFKKSEKIIDINPQPIECPDIFYYLKDAKTNDQWAIIARHYLEEERNINPDSYPFMLSKKSDDIKLKKWHKRLIIPAFRNNNMIYYTGRALGSQSKKYENANIPHHNILYGFDEISKYTTNPIFVVEGFFDSYWVNGVAIIGNQLSPAQILILNKSSRQKVYIPDRMGDGHIAANQALDLGWSISTPDIGNCKDISEAVSKYGKLYVLKTIHENICSGFEARTKLAIYSK
jgi:hypothetical protein